MQKLIIFLLFFSLFSAKISSQHIVINEVAYDNETVLYDFENKTPDWIELYNAGDLDFNLESWFLSDNPFNPSKWKFPSLIILAHSFVFVFASNKDIINQTPYHTNFKLKSMQESVYLYDADTLLIDSIVVQCVPRDYSLGRFPDGSNTFKVFTNPSPNASNNNADTISILYSSDTLIFSHPNGIYNQAFELTLQSLNPENTIYYTLNGEEPEDEMFEYQDVISVYDRSIEENVYSEIQTGNTDVEPSEKVFKANVVRAVVYNNGCPASKVITKTYFVNPYFHQRYPTNVVSVVSDPDGLFDKDEGIYVPGLYYNFSQTGKAWEREGHIEIFNTNGEIITDQDANLRIHGRGSRAGAQKSLRLYADTDDDDLAFNFQYFPEKNINSFKRLMLRATFSDWSHTLFKDEVCHAIVQDLNIDYMESMPTVVFLNGEYWGIHHLRERQDEYYIQSNHNISDDSIDIIKYEKPLGPLPDAGTLDAYNSLLSFIMNNDLADKTVYDELKNRMDISNTIDYFVAQIYFANSDFPNLNLALWKAKNTPEIPWRYLFYDCDACMMQAQYNILLEYMTTLDEYYRYDDWATVIFKNLLKNQEFKNQFHARFLALLETTFSPGNVIQIIDDFTRTYEPLVHEHTMRWHNPSDIQQWYYNVDGLKSFAMHRPAELLEQLDKYFGNPFHLSPNPSNGCFKIHLHDISFKPSAIKILDMNGRTVYQWQPVSFAETISINTSLSNGFYILQLDTQSYVFSEKLIIAQ